MEDKLTIEEERDLQELKAWTNLARYKFLMFGYHAANWVTLNRLIGDKKPNPFRKLVKFACEKYKLDEPDESYE